MADAWYYKLQGQENGPVAFDDISDMAQSGRLSPSDEIRFGDAADWMPAESVDGLFPESDEPETLSNLDDLNFSYENSPAQPQQAAVQAVGDLTELNDLSELNFDLVSEDPKPTAPATSRPQPVQPDRVETGSVGTIDPEDSWYYQSLGQELGPMSFEELCGLAESGALSSGDLVRKGTTDDWQPASTNTVLTMLLKAVAAPETSEEVSPPAKPPSATKNKRAKSKKKKRRKPAKEKPPEPPADMDLIDDEPEDEQPKDENSDEEKTKDDAVAEQPAQPVDRWYCKIDGVEHGPLEFEDLKAMATHQRLNRGDQVKQNDDGQWALATTTTGLFDAGSSTTAPAAPSTPAVPSGIGARPPSSGPSKPSPSKAPKTKRVKADRGPLFEGLGDKKPVIFAILAMVGLSTIVAVLGITMDGSESREHFATLQGMYNEHKALRDRKAKEAEWAPLIKRAVALKGTMIKSLEKTASAKNAGDQAMLFASRDFLVMMLKNSQKKSTKAEEDFKEQMARAAKFLGIK